MSNDNTAPVLTPLMRARIAGAVGKRVVARRQYAESRNEAEAHRNAIALRKATEVLESADYVEALLARIEELERGFNAEASNNYETINLADATKSEQEVST